MGEGNNEKYLKIGESGRRLLKRVYSEARLPSHILRDVFPFDGGRKQ